MLTCTQELTKIGEKIAPSRACNSVNEALVIANQVRALFQHTVSRNLVDS